jgi:hypothetical protein
MSLINGMDVYARLHREDDPDGEYSLRLAITATDIEIKTNGGTSTLSHDDFDRVAQMVNRCRTAWLRLGSDGKDDDPEPATGRQGPNATGGEASQ